MTTRNIDRTRTAVIQQVLSVVLMVAFAIFSARWLGPAGKGELALVTTAGVVAMAVIGLGIPQALTVWTSSGRLSVQESVLVGALWSAVLAIVLGIVGAVLPVNTLAIRMLWLSVGVGMIEQVMTSVSVGAGDMGPMMISRVLGGGSQVVFLALAWVIAFPANVKLAVWIYYALAMIGVAVALSALWVRSHKRGSGGPSLSRVRGEARGIFGFGLKVVPVQVLAMANARLDVLVLGALAGTAAVGIYSVAVSATLLVGMVPAALGQALTKSFGSDENPVRQLRAGIQIALVSGLAVAIGIAALSPWVVPLVFGRAFSSSVLLIAVMVPFTAVFATVQVSYPFFYNHLHRPGVHSVVIGATAAIDLGLLAVLVPSMGALGAALASAVAYAIGAALNLAITSRATGLSVLELTVPSRDDLKWMFERTKALMMLPGRM